jgi:hypothetical protein
MQQDRQQDTEPELVRKLLRRESFLSKQGLEQRIKRSSPTSIAKPVS